ncbi:MAG: Nickel-binding periplasmic protein precursor [Candidatus Heimdallarchaeota archaeon LC_2]|nr:MAG: Nickel-binding periplasmic protein precursor [Candidatus Heimdallarchaeota archaeon LC_2]
MTQRKLVKFYIIIVLFLGSLFITTVNSDSNQNSDYEGIQVSQETNTPPDILRIPQIRSGSISNLTTRALDPWFHFAISTSSWWPLVYSQLIDYDIDAQKFIPKLAIDWYSDFTGTVWTFTLRENVQFHDGTKFDTSSILTEINRGIEMKNKGLLTPENSLHYAFLDGIQQVTKLSEYKLSFKLVKAFSPFLTSLVTLYFAAPSASVGITVIDRIGSGPYIFDKFNSNSFVEKFNRNELYFEGVPPFKVVEMIDYRDGDQELAMRNNQLDLLPLYFHDFEMTDISYIVRQEPIVSTMGIYNTQNPIFSNVKVRQALNYAVDHAKLNEELFDGFLGATFDDFRYQNYTVFPGAANNAPKVQNQFTFDLLKASKMLDEAGYELNSNGNRFNITIVSRDDGFHVTLVDTIIETFELLGIGITRESDSDQIAQKFFTLDFDLWIGGFLSTVPDPFRDSALLRSDSVFNNGYYSNQTLDKLYESIASTAIRNRQYLLYSQIADHMRSEAPYLQLDSWGVIHPIRKEFVGHVTLGYGDVVSFTYLDENLSNVISSEFTTDDANVYSLRLNLGITKIEQQDFNVQKSGSINNFNEQWEIQGKEVFAFSFDQVDGESTYQMLIFLEPDSTLDFEEIKVYSIENNELAEIQFNKNSELLKIEFETAGDIFISVSIGSLQLDILPKTQNPSFLSSRWGIVITLGLSIFVVLGFGIDYVKKNAGKYDGFKYNIQRYKLYLPEKSKIALSVLFGTLLTSGFILLDRIVSSIGILVTHKEKETIESGDRPNVVIDGHSISPEQFDSQNPPKIKGRTMDMYYYLINNTGFHGVRELQRELGYSTPSLVYYHLNRLIKANTIKKNDEGQYGIPAINLAQTINKKQLDYYERIVPRTFLIGVVLISSFFSLIIVSIFLPTIRIWVVFTAPVLLFLSIFQFREGLNLLWNLRIESHDSGAPPVKFDNIQNKIAVAISLKKSSRAKDLFEAQSILEDVLKQDNLSKELAIIVLFNLCSILVDEMQIKQEESILLEAEKLTERVIDLSIQLETKTMSVEAYFIKSKFHLIRGQFDEAFESLVRSEELADKDPQLTKRIKREYNNLQNEITRIQQLGKSVSLSDKIEKIKIHEYIDQILQNWDLSK